MLSLVRILLNWNGQLLCSAERGLCSVAGGEEEGGEEDEGQAKWTTEDLKLLVKARDAV